MPSGGVGLPSMKPYMFLPPLLVTITSTKRTAKRGPGLVPELRDLVPQSHPARDSSKESLWSAAAPGLDSSECGKRSIKLGVGGEGRNGNKMFI